MIRALNMAIAYSDGLTGWMTVEESIPTCFIVKKFLISWLNVNPFYN